MLFKLLRYDIKWGIIAKWKKYLIMFVISLFITIFFIKNCEFYYHKGSIETMPGFLDYILNLLHGMKKFIPNGKDNFKIPIEWMTFHLLIAFFVGNYTSEDMDRCGINVITRVKSRKKWIISKILWNALAVISFYFVIYFSNLLIAVIKTGRVNMSLTQSITSKFYEVNLVNNQMKYIIALLLLPILSSLAISQFQLFLSHFVKPIISFLVVVSILLLSAYTMSPYLIGNYSMVQRSEVFISGGISVSCAVTINLLIIILSVVGSVIYFNKKNIL